MMSRVRIYSTNEIIDLVSEKLSGQFKPELAVVRLVFRHKANRFVERHELYPHELANEQLRLSYSDEPFVAYDIIHKWKKDIYEGLFLIHHDAIDDEGYVDAELARDLGIKDLVEELLALK